MHKSMFNLGIARCCSFAALQCICCLIACISACIPHLFCTCMLPLFLLAFHNPKLVSLLPICCPAIACCSLMQYWLCTSDFDKGWLVQMVAARPSFYTQHGCWDCQKMAWLHSLNHVGKMGYHHSTQGVLSGCARSSKPCSTSTGSQPKLLFLLALVMLIRPVAAQLWLLSYDCSSMMLIHGLFCRCLCLWYLASQ